MARELPLTIVVNADDEFMFMVGRHKITGIEKCYVKKECPPIDPRTHHPMPYELPKVTTTVELKVSVLDVMSVETLSDAFKPAWMLRLRKWWRGLKYRLQNWLYAEQPEE